MTTSTEKHTFARLLRENIVNLCRSNSSLARSGDGPVQIDAIICVSGQRDGDELVVKVHEKILNDNGVSVKSLLFPDNESGEEHHNESGPSESGSCKRFKDENPESPGTDMEEEQEQPEGYADFIEQNGNQYLGKSAFLSSPYHLQKKTPLRSERWTPTMPIPTTPECKACGFTFENFDVLSEHNEAVHSVFTCNSCHKTFTSRSNLERHSRLHTGFKPYVCAICHKAFSRKDHLSNHAAKHAFKCATCNKRFADKKSLASHHLYEHESPLSHVCDFCNKGFGNQELYEEHVKTHPQYHAVMQRFNYQRSSTPSPRKLSCPQCQFSSHDKITLLKHCIQHNENHRCYTCLSCAKTFSDPLRYDEHLSLHKAEHNIFECCLCRQVFPTLDVLKRHEPMHLNENDVPVNSEMLPCNHCNKYFPDEGQLHEHLAMHSALVHRCSFCQLAFSSTSELHQHMTELRHFPQQSSEPTDLSMKSEHGNGGQEQPSRDPTPPRNPTPSEQLPAEEENEDVTMPDKDEIGSDIEVVEPQAPEEAETTPAGEPFKVEPVRSILGNKLTQERARKRKAPSPEKFVPTPSPEKFIPAPPPYVEPAMGGYYRPAEPYEIVPQDLSLKRVNNHMNALAARAAAAYAEEHLRAAHERYRLDLERLERERQERDRYEKLQRERESQRTPQPSKPGIDIPPGPQTCSVCNTTFGTFHEMETHCFVEHNRSPCMFCSKTFAQKANRDRHVCLHTGDKPYSCPDCDEKFSRGDKLKLHRVRAHNLQVNSSPLLGRGNNKDTGSNANSTTGWSSPSTNHSEDSTWPHTPQPPPFYKKEGELDVVHAGGEWSMVTEENGHTAVTS